MEITKLVVLICDMWDSSVATLMTFHFLSLSFFNSFIFLSWKFRDLTVWCWDVCMDCSKCGTWNFDGF